MAVIVAQNTNDQAALGPAIDEVLASGKAPPEQAIQLYTAQAQTAFNAGKLDVADKAFTQVNTLKPNDPEILISLAAVKSRENQTPAALQYTDQAIAAQKATGQPVDEDWYRRALAIAYDGKQPAGVVKYGQQLVDSYPRADIWRIALQTYRETSQLDPQVDLDTLRLMRATNSLAGERDYYEYANTALNKGFPGEAKAVIDQGVSSNMVDNKALATSKALAEIKAIAGPKVAADKADLPNADKKARAAAKRHMAYQTATPISATACIRRRSTSTRSRSRRARGCQCRESAHGRGPGAGCGQGRRGGDARQGDRSEPDDRAILDDLRQQGFGPCGSVATRRQVRRLPATEQAGAVSFGKRRRFAFQDRPCLGPVLLRACRPARRADPSTCGWSAKSSRWRRAVLSSGARSGSSGSSAGRARRSSG